MGAACAPQVRGRDDPRSPDLKGRLLVRADSLAPQGADGMLGQAWFGGRVWTFDYPGRRLLLQPLEFKPEQSTAVPVGFPTDADGRPSTHFPSISAQVDGQDHWFLFDTGATAHLSLAARDALGASERIATCFVVASVFETWRTAHPEWPVVHAGDLSVGGQDLIQAPEVTVAGVSVGPVWFARRPDPAFHDDMTSMMDRPVDGALGGSLLRHFRITVDYPGAVAYFESHD